MDWVKVIGVGLVGFFIVEGYKHYSKKKIPEQ